MGVGVYRNSFGGSGSTFEVSGPLPTEEDYNRLSTEEEDMPSFEAWATQEYDDAFDALMRDIQDAAAEIGLSPSRGSETVRFDRSFFAATSDNLVDIGIKFHESDLIVATAGGYQFAKWMQDPNGHMAEIMEATGRAVDGVVEEFVALSNQVEAYIRLSLLENGYDCRFATSAWTTDSYDKPDDIEAEKAMVKERVTELRAKLSLSAEEAILNATGDERQKMLEDIVEAGNSYDIFVPVFSREGGYIALYNQTRDRFDESSAIQTQLPHALYDLDAEDGFAAVPRSEEFATLFTALAQKAYARGGIVVSFAEFASVTNDDEIELQFEGENGWEVVSLAAGDPSSGLHF